VALSFVRAATAFGPVEQKDAAVRLRRIVDEAGARSDPAVRFPDQHGILRGKTLIAR